MAERTLSLGTLFTGQVTPSFTQAIQRMETYIDGLRTKMEAFNRGARSTGSAFSTTATQIKNAGNAVATASQSLNTALTSHTKAQKALAATGQAARTAQSNMTLFQQGVKNLTSSLKSLASYGVAASILFGVAAATKSAISEIIDYDQALHNIQAITRATDAELGALDDKIREVARTTKFSTVEVAEGVVLLGQAGFSAAESLQAIQAVSDLATGTLTSLELAADLLTTTIRAFNLNAAESTRVADVMANAINRSKLTIDKLRIAFNFVGAVAHQAGLSLEQTAASMMVLANNGIRASTIGTGLRQVLSRLIAPNKKLREAYQEHNIALDKVNPSIVGYETALKNLSEVLYDSEKKTVDMGKAFQLFGLRGAQAAAIIVHGYISGDFEKALANTYKAGSAAEMAALQAEGLGIKFKNLVDRAKLVALAFGDGGVAGALGIFVDALRLVFEALEYLAGTAVGQAVIQLGILSVVIWAATKAYLALEKTLVGTAIQVFILDLINAIKVGEGFNFLLGKITAGLNALWAAMSKHPILLIASAIAALVVGMNSYINGMEQAGDTAAEEAIKLQSLSESAQVYGKALEDLIKKKKEGQDVSKEYQAVIKRLGLDHKELAGVLNATNTSLEGMLNTQKVLTEYMEAKTHAALLKNVEAIKNYKDAAYGLTNSALRGLQNGLNSFIALLSNSWEMSDYFTWATDRTTDALAKMKVVENQVNAELKNYIVQQGLSEQEAMNFLDRIILLVPQLKELASALKNEVADGFKRMREAAKVSLVDMDYDPVIESIRVLSSAADTLGRVKLANLSSSIKSAQSSAIKHMKEVGYSAEEIAAGAAAVAGSMFFQFNWAAEKTVASEQDKKAKVLEINKSLAKDMKTWLDASLLSLDEEYNTKRTNILVEGGEETNKKLADLDKSYQAETAKRYKDYYGYLEGIGSASKKVLEEIGVATNKAGKTLQQRAAANNKKYFEMLTSWQEDETIKIELEYEKRLADAEKWWINSKNIFSKNSGALAAAEKQYLHLRTAAHNAYLIDKFNIEKDAELKLSEIIKLEQQNRLQAERNAFTGNTEELRRIRTEELSIEMEYAAKEMDAAKEKADNVAKLRGKESNLYKDYYAKYLTAKRNYLNAAGLLDQDEVENYKRHLDELLEVMDKKSRAYWDLQKKLYGPGGKFQDNLKYIQLLKQEWSSLFSEIELGYATGIVSSQDFANYMEEGFKRGAVSAREASETVITVNGTMWDRLKLGMQRWLMSTEQVGERIIKLVGEVITQFADGLTDALWDVVWAGDSLKESMEEFAKSFLEWIAKIIIKELVWLAIRKAIAATFNAMGWDYAGMPSAAGLIPGVGGSGPGSLLGAADVGKSIYDAASGAISAAGAAGAGAGVDFAMGAMGLGSSGWSGVTGGWMAAGPGIQAATEAALATAVESGVTASLMGQGGSALGYGLADLGIGTAAESAASTGALAGLGAMGGVAALGLGPGIIGALFHDQINDLLGGFGPMSPETAQANWNRQENKLLPNMDISSYGTSWEDLDSAVGDFERLGTVAGYTQEQLNAVYNRLGDTSRAALGLGLASEELTDKISSIAYNFANWRIDSNDMSRSLETLSSNLGLSGNAATTFKSQVAQLAQELKAGTISGDVFNNRLKDLARSALSAVTKSAGSTVGAINSIRDAIKGVNALDNKTYILDVVTRYKTIGDPESGNKVTVDTSQIFTGNWADNQVGYVAEQWGHTGGIFGWLADKYHKLPMFHSGGVKSGRTNEMLARVLGGEQIWSLQNIRGWSGHNVLETMRKFGPEAMMKMMESVMTSGLSNNLSAASAGISSSDRVLEIHVHTLDPNSVDWNKLTREKIAPPLQDLYKVGRFKVS